MTTGDTPSRPVAIRVSDLKPINAGALRCLVNVALPSGMILLGCAVFVKDDRTWAAPPGKPVIGRAGIVEKTPQGKTRYEPTVSFADRATAERWSDAVIAAVRLAYPEAIPAIAADVRLPDYRPSGLRGFGPGER
jgi:hypothetical protein